MLQLAQALLPPGSRLLYLTHFGSRLYGTDTLTSDTDLKGVFLPSLQDIVLGKVKDTIEYNTGDDKSKNNTNDIDITMYSLQYFMTLLTTGEVGAIDLLFSMFRSSTILYEEKQTTDYLRTNYKSLISKQSKRFVGYCFNQAAKYGIKGSRYGDLLTVHEFLSTIKAVDAPISEIVNKLPVLSYVSLVKIGILEYIQILGKLHQTNLPVYELKQRVEKALDSYGHRTRTAFTSQGVDWKALSHAYRVIYQMHELASKEMIVFPLDIADKLKTIKTNTDIVLLQPIVDELAVLLAEVSIAVDNSSLPDFIDGDFIATTILSAYNLKKEN